MNRLITVKGTGKYSAKPDTIILSLVLSAQKPEYGTAMALAEAQIEKLRKALALQGFEKNALKTTGFNVDTQYESQKDKYGNYQRYFAGYQVDHRLSLEFPLDTQKLAQVLGVIASSQSDPELHIAFTVKDKDAVCAALLEDAAKNAKAKAETLAKASGIKLGQLVSIDYNWGEINITSDTKYMVAERCMTAAPTDGGVDIEPEDIHVTDTVTFVWEMA